MCTVDWGNSYHDLRWSGWNHRVARATGTVRTGCAPNFECAADRPARLRLSHPVDCGSALFFYTRLRVRPAGRPAYTEELDCPIQGDGDI